MQPFIRIPKRALPVLGAGVIALAVFGTAGIGPLQAAAGSPRAATTTAAGAAGWAGQAGVPGFAGSQQAVTTLLGLTTDEIRAQRLDGKSLAQIAQARGVSTDKLVATIVTAARDRLQTLVHNGTLTQALADQRLQTITSQVTAMVQSTATGPGHAGRGFGHGMRGQGHGSMAPAASATPGA